MKIFIQGILFFFFGFVVAIACNDAEFDNNPTVNAPSFEDASNEPKDAPAKPEPKKQPESVGGNVDANLPDTTIVDDTFVECAPNLEASVYPIKALLYELPVDTPALPNFASLPAIKTVCMKQLDIATRDFEDGFPGVDNLIEWFGLDIRFKVDIPADGNYTFFVNSDDGSKLYIDGNLVIDNDGQHSPRELSASVNLTKGIHSFKVEYFQGPKTQIALELFWQSESFPKAYIDPSYLKPDLDPNFNIN